MKKPLVGGVKWIKRCATKGHMLLNHFALLFMLCVVFINVNGCTIQLTCDLYNHTEEDLKVIQINSDGIKVEREFKARSWIELEGWQLFNYKIVSQKAVWKYNQLAPDHTFISFKGLGPWSKRVFRAQLEKDGRIFVLRFDNISPDSVFLKQPEGFPLAPQMK